MRKLILDTESTGLGPNSRIVEIALIDTYNDEKTGFIFHSYVNPERPVEPGAFNVHGLSNEFLADKPTFSQIWQNLFWFLNLNKFILVAHNAQFDMALLNREIIMQGVKPIPDNLSFCTLNLARQRFKGGIHSLDALCKKLGIANDNRQLHGALLDANLLFEVYKKLI